MGRIGKFRETFWNHWYFISIDDLNEFGNLETAIENEYDNDKRDKLADIFDDKFDKFRCDPRDFLLEIKDEQ